MKNKGIITLFSFALIVLATGGKADSTSLAETIEQSIRLYNRGNAYYDKGDYDSAIADYTEAIRLDPGSASVYNNRGIAYKNKGA